MTTFVALLRAANVGGTKVDMAELRRGLDGLGLKNVQTYVQSGNVVFAAERDDPHELAAEIERLIKRTFDLDVKVLVLAAAELAQIAAANPFLEAGTDAKFLHATFLFAKVTEAATAALALPAADGEQVSLVGRVLYLHLPHGYGRTKLSNAYFERALRTPATTRNWRTVTALVEMSSHPT
jgi:uncharacterized protein (DUF1697 family)